MLQQMSGKTHHVYTGVALQQEEKAADRCNRG